MDEIVRDQMKRLNMEKYKTTKKQKKLEELQTQYNSMVQDASAAVETDAGESEDAEVSGTHIKLWSIKFYV